MTGYSMVQFTYHQLCAVAKLVDEKFLILKSKIWLANRAHMVKSSFWGLTTIASKHTQPDFGLLIVVMGKKILYFKGKITQNDCSHVKKSVSMKNA
jgi:hypothetical protein